jgi:hypothetical protein
MKQCQNCRYYEFNQDSFPCCYCVRGDRWEIKNDCPSCKNSNLTPLQHPCSLSGKDSNNCDQWGPQEKAQEKKMTKSCDNCEHKYNKNTHQCNKCGENYSQWVEQKPEKHNCSNCGFGGTTSTFPPCCSCENYNLWKAEEDEPEDCVVQECACELTKEDELKAQVKELITNCTDCEGEKIVLQNQMNEIGERNLDLRKELAELKQDYDQIQKDLHKVEILTGELIGENIQLVQILHCIVTK